jgi:rhamnose utilization protein RhaD (predicted bifunctional aldolase and dehydrogenase)/NAD(P)-dependent dehydrogenase (short-subunit alcohol dehydrogenase family)
LTTWNDSDAGATAIEQLVYLSNLIGADTSLVQPGGGNTSVKVEEVDGFGCSVQALVVKGSGTDLRTIGPGGFTHLYLDRLGLALTPDPSPERGRGENIGDEEMMSLMRGCMLAPDRDPLPSVETPLHSLLPAKFVAHTHDVATLSLTDTPSARDNVRQVFGESVAFLEYVRPGFPLAKRLAERMMEKAGNRKQETGSGALAMEKHGLAVWGETARECWETLSDVIGKAEAFVAEAAKGKRAFGAAAAPFLEDEERRGISAQLLPMLRGELVRQGFQCVLVHDDSSEARGAISGEGFGEIAARGVMTPEHILRAGAYPLYLRYPLEPTELPPEKHHRVALRFGVGAFRDGRINQVQRVGRESLLPDFLKTVIVPGLGIVYAGKDRRNALIAAECYSATMRAMAGAEAVERFEFLSEDDAFEMEYWPLERRKIEESSKTRRDLEGKVALVMGAGSGIGRAAALLFVQEGAHVVCADLDGGAAEALAAEMNAKAPERALGVALDVTDGAGMASAVRETVLRFGGIDVMLYSPGIAPELHSVTEMPEAEVERHLAVQYRGAVAATREVSRVMRAQGTGGRLVYNVSKSAFVPGDGAAAYGASKAALAHYVRNVAKELGRDGITANYINADAVDTPLFRALVKRRAKEQGITEEQMLQRYADRGVFGTALVPPEAVAEAALWLASDRSAHTTGCVITVGGGPEGFPR